MKTKKIVITGGPSTGKTTIINHLESVGKKCIPEISREIIITAQRQGIEQLFLESPTVFNQKVLEGRTRQFLEAEKEKISHVFLDRGIPDIIAYTKYIGHEVLDQFIKAGKEYRYDQVFILPPWKEIHSIDHERYENFEQAQQIYDHLLDTYKELGYDCIEVPFGNIKDRSNFILQLV